jgi:hypothetical protein
MNASEVLQAAAAVGITIRAVDGQLEVKPRSKVTPELRTAILENKTEILGRVEEWIARKIEIPNQNDPREIDVWQVVYRPDSSVIRWWFLETIRHEIGEKG